MKLSPVEGIKENSGYLAGGLEAELANSEPSFAPESQQLLKFHGIYQQDDRDIRKERAKQGLGKDFLCMVRASIPGGALTGAQYLAMDALADEVADGTLRVTTRQGIQYHFTRKSDLKRLVRTLNEHLVTTLSACGDVVRNVMCCPLPHADRESACLEATAAELGRHLRPQSESYWQLWVDGERAASAVQPADPDTPEPLYGTTYLPRKFKIGIAHPGDNCVDVFTHDVGVVPHLELGRVDHYSIVVGGGLGMSHNNDKTYPRLADPLCSVGQDELIEVVTEIIAIQRDHGDRADRKHARLKYLVDDWGLDAFKAELERRLGRPLAAPKPLEWKTTDDHLGWTDQGDDRWTLGVRVANGRVADTDVRMRSGLRTVIERFGADVRLTPRQDVLLTNIAESDRADVEAVLREHAVPLVEELAPVARHAMACPALPTCGLALAEAERAMPALIDELQAELVELGLDREALHVRMTGCPNGCARPYSTEIGVVGRGKDHYSLLLGGDADGTRLNTVYADRISGDDLVSTLSPVLRAFREEREGDESFGAFCDRVGVVSLRERFTSETDAA